MKNNKTPLRIDLCKSKFLKPTAFKARNGKTVYIDKVFHEKLSLIVFMLGGGKLTIADYLHNILEHHFDDFGAELTAIYNTVDKPKF